MDFIKQLKRQLDFLNRSSDSFDYGYKDEAIRIAVVLRVLFHDTRNSTSLLKHLKSKHLNLLCTCPVPHPNTIMFYGLGYVEVDESGNSIYNPDLEDSYFRNEIPINEWWNQIVYVLDRSTKLSRSDIILAASNKDGGTHVDKQLTPVYEKLTLQSTYGNFQINVGKSFKNIEIAEPHLVALRQMSFEVLNSPDIINLCS